MVRQRAALVRGPTTGLSPQTSLWLFEEMLREPLKPPRPRETFVSKRHADRTQPWRKVVSEESNRKRIWERTILTPHERSGVVPPVPRLSRLAVGETP